MNKVVLIGRLTKDPELKFIAGTGTPITKITLAVNRKFASKGQQEADFIPVILWNKQAENTANYVVKGKLVSVSGRIQTRSYDKGGIRVYVTEVVADEIQFLERSNGSVQGNSRVIIDGKPIDGIEAVDDGDIPF